MLRRFILCGTAMPPAAYLLPEGVPVLKVLLFCVLVVFCWPLAVVAVILYPLIWLVLLPFRLVGIVFEGVFDLIAALFSLPGRLVRAL